MTTIQVNVTQECIDKGVHMSASRCMVHRAMHEHIDDRYTFTVGVNQCTLMNAGRWTSESCFNFPKIVYKNILAWDRGEMIYPFAFEIDIPDEYLKAIPVENWPSEVAVERVKGR